MEGKDEGRRWSVGEMTPKERGVVEGIRRRKEGRSAK
jgi:hypothetical protein